MMFSRSPRISAGLAAAVSLIALHAAPALAYEPSGNAVADAFLSLLEADKGKVESYGSVDADGDKVTISDLVLSNETKENSKVTIGSTVLTNGEVETSGRLKLQELGIESLTLTSDDGGMSLKSFTATELVLPTPEEMSAATPSVNPAYKSLVVDTVEIRDEDGPIAKIDTIQSAIDGIEENIPTDGSFSVTGAVVDINRLASKETKSIQELGYDKVSFDVAMSAKWDPEAATLKVEEFKLDVEEAASLSLYLSLGGVTQEVVSKLNQKPQKPEEAMAILQNVTIEAAKIRLDDASLTGRILDQEAKKAGVETPVYVQGLTGMLPVMLGMLQNKELEAQVSSAVTQFLTDPDSLEVTAAPGAPVPIAQIMGTAMLAPQMIPQILSVAVTANQ